MTILYGLQVHLVAVLVTTITLLYSVTIQLFTQWDDIALTVLVEFIFTNIFMIYVYVFVIGYFIDQHYIAILRITNV